MAEVFERFRIHGDEAQAYLLLLAPTFSLNSLPKMFDDRGCSDLVMDTREPSVEEQLHASNRAEEVEKALTILGPQEREILRMSFGLDGNGVMADPEIAKALEMTNERMKQIRRRALSILRKNSRLKNFGENPSVFGA
jgi:RNA polymerase sigma factor (sigma-70 family)